MTRVFCSQCNAEAGEGDRFCPECGAAVDAAAPAEPAAGASTRGARRWLGRRGLFVAIPVAAVLAGAALAASLVLGDVPEDHAIELVPADAAFYATAHLDPSLGQKRAAKSVLDSARQAGAEQATEDSLEDAIRRLVDRSTPVDYARDVQPQLGDQIAVYTRGQDPTLIVATKDSQASLETMRRMLRSEYSSDYYRVVQATHRGQRYEHVVYDDGDGAPSWGPSAFTIVDGFVVIGSEDDVKASIDARDGDSLESSERFAAARSRLSDDVLAVAYYDADPMLDTVRASEGAPSEEIVALEALADSGPVVATVAAHDDRLELDMAGLAFSGDAQPLQNPSALLETLPADAIGAISFGDVGGPLRKALEDGSGSVDDLREAVSELANLDVESDVASWLGQLGAYVAGDDTDRVQGALVAETRSAADSDRALSQIESYYTSDSDYDSEYSYGTSVYASEDGRGFDVADDGDVLRVRGDEDRVIAGTGAADFTPDPVLDADGGFGESDAYRRAARSLGGAYEPFLVIDVPPMQRLLEQAADAEYDHDYTTDVRPWLSSVLTLAGGVRNDGDGVRVRIFAELAR